MRKPHLIKLILLSFFLIGFPSCEEGCICCEFDGPVRYDARIVGFAVERVDKRVTSTQWAAYLPGDTVNASRDLVIYLKPDLERVVLNNNLSKNGLFVNSAFACTPAQMPRTDQILTNLKITSTEDFNAYHPAGSDLIGLFDISGIRYSAKNQKIPLSQYLAGSRNDFLISAPSLFLNESPENQSTHIFKFQLELSDTTLHFQTPELILK
ncbi:hypothetical protein [Lunatibacter salilacus]|uniref:hypothetical protein n=1 Tax=Lunatibacter salilacus TaxID=2483804 RepID=UPI00131B6C73|nr:hypothetical protein [Lunatibacter salilacus]